MRTSNAVRAGCFRRRTAVLLFLLVAVSAVSVRGTLAAPVSPTPHAAAHAPILIDDNAGFNATNGVVSGSGTSLDPYVLGPWDISAISGPGLTIRNTTAYFVLRDLNIAGSGSSTGPGIVLTNLTHASVLRVNVSGSARGVVVNDADDVEVASSNLSSNAIGLELLNVRNSSVANTSFFNDGPLSYGVPTGEAIYVASSLNVGFEFNTFTANGRGVWATASTALRFVSNRFLSNAHQASDDSAKDFWNWTYPEGGNFWSDYRGYDDCRGPLQDDCTGGDGLGDTPYGVPTSPTQPLPTVLDHYPLVPVNPPNQMPVAQFAVSTPTPWTRQTVTFDGTVAYDPDGFLTASVWTFGDGFSASGPTVTHAYAAPGNYTATLTVTDNRGATAFATRAMKVTTWVQPTVSLVLWSCPKGYELPIPSGWSREENVSMGTNATMDLYAYGTYNGTPATLVVSEAFDPTVREDRAYLAETLNATVAGLQKQYPSLVAADITFRTLSGHTALLAVLRYGALYQDVAILTSVALHAGWFIILSAAASEEGNLNGTWQQILSGFTITAVPPAGPGLSPSFWLWVAVGGATGGVIGAVAGLLYYAKRKARPRRPVPPLPPPYTP